MLFFLFLWVSTIVKSCGNEKNPTTSIASSTQENSEDTYDRDDFFEDVEDDIASDDPSDMSTESEDQLDYTEIDKVVEDNLNEQESEPAKPVTNRPSSQSKPTTNTSPRVSKSNSNGKYMVIAGSFLIKDNAQDMQKRLSKLGYDNSELVVFDLSQYHSVVASRYSTYEAALKVSNELKRSGVDCYVHAQQF